jgi:hypothetical protein
MVVGEAGAVSPSPSITCIIADGITECGAPQYFVAQLSVTNSQGKHETATDTVQYYETGGKIVVRACVAAIAGTALQTTFSDGTTLIFDGAIAKYSMSCVYGAVVGFLGWL